MSLSIQEIKNIIEIKKRGFIILHEQLLEGYEGMYDDYSLIYKNDIVSLRQTFICYGLDGFGDDLYEDYEYSFDSLEKMLTYLENKLKIKLKDMKELDTRNVITQIDSTKEQAEAFKKDWARFQQDFKAGKFLDKNLKLINS